MPPPETRAAPVCDFPVPILSTGTARLLATPHRAHSLSRSPGNTAVFPRRAMLRPLRSSPHQNPFPPTGKSDAYADQSNPAEPSFLTHRSLAHLLASPPLQPEESSQSCFFRSPACPRAPAHLSHQRFFRRAERSFPRAL